MTEPYRFYLIKQINNVEEELPIQTIPLLENLSLLLKELNEEFISEEDFNNIINDYVGILKESTNNAYPLLEESINDLKNKKTEIKEYVKLFTS